MAPPSPRGVGASMRHGLCLVALCAAPLLAAWLAFGREQALLCTIQVGT
jgi:hypothetical protein